jgi:hypothetical protein
MNKPTHLEESRISPMQEGVIENPFVGINIIGARN